MPTKYILSVIYGGTWQPAYVAFDLSEALAALKEMRRAPGAVCIEVFNESGLLMQWTEGAYRRAPTPMMKRTLEMPAVRAA